MRFYRLTLITTFALALLITAALLIGRAQPVPDRLAMLHLNDCARPCWIGITPGVTRLDEAYRRVEQVFADPLYHLSKAQGSNGVTYTIREAKDENLEFSVQIFSLQPPLVATILLQLDQAYINNHWVFNSKAVLTFGDLNTLWGNPMYIEAWACYGDWVPYYDAQVMTYVIVAPSDGFPDADARVSWNSLVASIRMSDGKVQLADFTMVKQWRGFSSYRQYGYRDYALEGDKTC
jgi:hypothetical protein